MALFGRTTAESLLKRLRDPSVNAKVIEDTLDSLRFAQDFTLDKAPWLFWHREKKVREFALHEARAFESKTLGDQLAMALIEQRSDVRRDVAVGVQRVAESRVVLYLTKFMSSKEQHIRESALELIDASEDFRKYLGHLKAGLRDTIPKVRQRTVRILCRQSQDQTVILILRGLLHDSDDTVRHLVIEALAKDPTPEIIEPFFHRLAHEGPETRAVMVRALRQLTRSGSQHQIEKELLPILADEDEHLRQLAVKILGELPDQVRVVRNFLIESSGLAFWLRERSIESMQAASGDLIPALCQLIGDEHEGVRVGALQMASLSNDPRLLPSIRAHFLGDFDWWERSMSAGLLGKFRSPEITEILLSKLGDPALRYSVIPALGRHATPDAVRALISCLRDSSRGIRMTTLETLARIRDPQVVEAVRQVGLSDTEEAVRKRAAETLRALKVDDDVLLHRIEEGPLPEKAPIGPPDDDIGGLQMENDALN